MPNPPLFPSGLGTGHGRVYPHITRLYKKQLGRIGKVEEGIEGEMEDGYQIKTMFLSTLTTQKFWLEILIGGYLLISRS